MEFKLVTGSVRDWWAVIDGDGGGGGSGGIPAWSMYHINLERRRSYERLLLLADVMYSFLCRPQLPTHSSDIHSNGQCQILKYLITFSTRHIPVIYSLLFAVFYRRYRHIYSFLAALVLWWSGDRFNIQNWLYWKLTAS